MSKSLEKKIIDICVFLHTELSSIHSELDDSVLELTEVLRLEPVQALELISENIKDLLKVKRNFVMIDEYKNYKAHEQYQKALQKLEGEVRHHIKIEQQMKLHIDSTQAKLEELEKTKDGAGQNSCVDALRKENSRLVERVKSLEKQTDTNEDKIRYIKELNMLKGLAQKDSQRNSDLEKINRKLEMEVSYLQRKLEMANRELVNEKYVQKENKPEIYTKKKHSEDDEIRVISTQLTDRCRNLSKSDIKKHPSKSPLPSRIELKRTESQFLSSSRGVKKAAGSLERSKKAHLHGNTNYSVR
jgi:valyl-tRNA synthetase